MRAGYVPQEQPVAPFTWEVQATLSRLQLTTARIPCRWHQPVRIVGFFPSVSQGSAVGGGLIIPTVNDILAIVSSNQKERYTNRLEDVTNQTLGEAYVSLGALSTSQAAGNRLLCIELNEAAPQIEIGFRWKWFPAGGPVFEDAIVSVAMFCELLKG